MLVKHVYLLTKKNRENINLIVAAGICAVDSGFFFRTTESTKNIFSGSRPNSKTRSMQIEQL